MPITISYPKIVELQNGNQIELSQETWKKRELLIVTDSHEQEIRKIFSEEQFVESKFGEEIVKTNQLGSGLRKKIDIWQLHVRLFPHGKYIGIDAEAELSNDFGVEHITHGWISAFKEIKEMIQRRLGKIWVFHKGAQDYVVKIIKEESVTLPDPETQTDPKLLVATVVIGALLGTLIVALLKK